MNGRYCYICPDTDSGGGIGENGEYENNATELPEINENSTDMVDTVSDAVGSDTDIVADTENGAESNESITLDNPESGMENENEYFADYPQNGELEYLPELEYIDYLLSEQIQNQIAVQSEDGKSIVVSIDELGMQTLIEIKENQLITHEKIDVMNNLVGCLLFAVIAEYLIMSSKRVMKKMVNRKE